MQPVLEPQKEKSQNSLSLMKLFIIDDEPLNVSLLEKMLIKAGYKNFINTSDSSTVIDTCRSYNPDLLLLDLRMPNMDGFQVMDLLKLNDTTRNIPVLVLTAEHNPETRLKALQCGAKDFISKPFNRTEVVTRIQNILETKLLQNHLQLQNHNLDLLVQSRTDELNKEQKRLEQLNNSLEEMVNNRTADLKRANKDLERINHTMSDLVSIVSHELRTPLTSIKSFAEILRDEKDNLDEESTYKFLSIINDESDRLSRLISDLLDLQKISSGKMTWKTKLVDMVDVVSKTVEFFKPAFNDKQLLLTSSVLIERAPVLSDEDKVRQVLTNLLSNALKFTELGQVTVNVDRTQKWAKVIILSDDLNTTATLKGIIESMEAIVIHFTQSQQAIDHIETFGDEIDLMIIDISTIHNNTIGTLEEIREKFPSLPFTTLHSGENDRPHQQIKSYSPSNSIKKPINPDRDKDNIELRITDLIGINPKLRMVRVSIKDSGIGIPENELNKVFKRFHQVDTSQIREHRGTGLGLTISREIIEHYHGKIWVESEMGKGSTFYVLLPEMHGQKKLGEILIEKGLVTEKQLNEALKDQT